MKIQKPLNILVMEGNPAVFFKLQECLGEIIPVPAIMQKKTLRDTISCLSENIFDVILLDLKIMEFAKDNSIQKITSLANGAAIIVLTGLGDNRSAIESLKLGVHDYLQKDGITTISVYKSVCYSLQQTKNAQLLKLYEEKYSYLFNNNPENIFVWEVGTLKIIDVNDTAVRLYGYTREELLKMTFSELFILNNEQPSLPADLISILSGQIKINNALWKQFGKDGGTMNIDFSLHQIMYNNKPAIMAMGNDVTKRLLLEKQLEEEKLNKQQELKEAIIDSQEKQRSEFCSELHDNVNQLLATSRLYLDVALTDRKLRLKLIEDSKNYILSAINEIRRLSKSMLPPALGETGLKKALEDLINSQRLFSKINFIFSWNDFNENFCKEKLKLAIYRIVQEQLTNTMRYAAADNIEIKLQQQGNLLQLQIKDDGVGFNLSEKRDGVGLQNINTRTLMNKGKMLLESAPGRGCNLVLEFPLRRLHRA